MRTTVEIHPRDANQELDGKMGELNFFQFFSQLQSLPCGCQNWENSKLYLCVPFYKVKSSLVVPSQLFRSISRRLLFISKESMRSTCFLQSPESSLTQVGQSCCILLYSNATFLGPLSLAEFRYHFTHWSD